MILEINAKQIADNQNKKDYFFHRVFPFSILRLEESYTWYIVSVIKNISLEEKKICAKRYGG